MNPVEAIYGRSFFKRRKSLIWRASILCKIIEEVFDFSPETRIVDVGCAIGEFIDEFKKMGYKFAFGIEGSPAVVEYSLIPIHIFDMRKPIIDQSTMLHKGFSFCMCLEVAEHIEEEYADIFVDNICHLSNIILFSAEPPGAKGHGHCNCQFPEYWENKFRVKNYYRDMRLEKKFKNLLEKYKRKKGLNGYYYNSMIFKYGIY